MGAGFESFKLVPRTNQSDVGAGVAGFLKASLQFDLLSELVGYPFDFVISIQAGAGKMYQKGLKVPSDQRCCRFVIE